MPSDEITLLVCTPRSGHSWLTGLLRSHPQLKVYTHDAYDNHVLYLLYPFKSVNPFSEDGTDRASRSERLLWPARRRFFRRHFRDVTSARRVLVSTSTAVAYLPLFLSAFPTARVIHLRRDPRDVIASFRRFMHSRDNGAMYQYRNHRHLGRPLALRYGVAHAAHVWRWLRCPHPGYLVLRPQGFQEAARLGLIDFLVWYYVQSERQIMEAVEQLPPAQLHTVTYEDLTGSYDDTMGALLRFIGADESEEFLATTRRTVISTNVGRHERDLTEAERRRVEELLAEQTPAATGDRGMVPTGYPTES